MEHDQVDTNSENEQHELIPDQTISEKPKRVRKPQTKKEVVQLRSESSHTTIDDNLRESTLDVITPDISEIQTENISDSEKPTQPPTVEQKNLEEENTSTIDNSHDSHDMAGVEEATSESNEIPPIQQIRELLKDFEMRVSVWGLTVFTADGYILAHRLFYDGMPENLEMIVSSMSAGLITISQDFIRLVASNSLFRQVLVDADDESGNVSFSVLLKQIAENVMLTCIFPSKAKLGLVSFEIENLSNDINEIVKLWDVKLHEETVT
ncbi:MAG: roadblock/LC7 domain-containing protein [Candidatus Thorarchaeota archaeon]